MKIAGIAHVQLTVSNLQRSREFYVKLLPYLGMQVLYDDPDCFYCIGGLTGIAITQTKDPSSHTRFDQEQIGLHHLCFRARHKPDIDKLYSFALSLRASIVYPPKEGPWAPGYYSTSFLDPDGIRLEANFIPGKGNLETDEKMALSRINQP